MTCCYNHTSSLTHDALHQNSFAYHPELFEHRDVALGTLADRGLIWFEHFGSIDLLHEVFGLEVCGIGQERDAKAILAVLMLALPGWRFSWVAYQPHGRDLGWKAIIQREPDSNEMAG